MRLRSSTALQSSFENKKATSFAGGASAGSERMGDSAGSPIPVDAFERGEQCPVDAYFSSRSAVPKGAAAAVGANALGLIAPKAQAKHSLPKAKADALTPILPKKGWGRINHAYLQSWLSKLAKRTPTGAQAAIFDWDKTSCAGDLASVLVGYIIENLKFKVTPEQFEKIWPNDAMGKTTFPDGTSMPALKADILEAYRVLWPSICSGNPQAIETAKSSTEFSDFRAKAWKFGCMYFGMQHEPKEGYIFVRFVAGYTKKELQELGGEIYRAEAGNFKKETWSSVSEGKAGAVSSGFRHGLMAREEIMDLMHAFQNCDVEPYVVTGNLADLVYGVVREAGYPIERKHCFGSQPQVDKDGRLTGKITDPAKAPIVLNEGKCRIIRDEIQKQPIFVAGDSDGDYEMLTSFAETETRLIMNRHLSHENISALYSLGLNANELESSPRNAILVQEVASDGTFVADIV